MNTPSGSSVRPSRLHRWLGLLLALLAPAAGLGCAALTTSTHVVDVPGLGMDALADMRMDVDPAVYAEMLKEDPQTGNNLVVDEAAGSGWEARSDPVKGSVTYTRRYTSSADLAWLPQQLAVLTGGLPFLRDVAVEIRPTATDTVEFEYTAVVDIPSYRPEDLKAELEVQTSAGGGLLGESSSTVIQIFKDQPGLEAAVYAAGPIEMNFEAYLPGTLHTIEINGKPAGVIGPDANGQSRALWTFATDAPGRYRLRALSTQKVGEEEANRILSKRPIDPLIEEFNRRWGLDPMTEAGAIAGARLARSSAATLLPATVAPERRDRIAQSLYVAGYLVSFYKTDAQGAERFAMPSVRASMPILLTLARKAATDDAALRTLERLVPLLAQMDMSALKP